jgi:ABC-type transport system substrate-binding protein
MIPQFSSQRYLNAIIPIITMYMQSMGLGVGFTTDAEWQAASFYSVNYTYNTDNQFRIDMLTLLQDNLGKIGINVVDNGLEWNPYLDLVQNRTAPGFDGLNLWFLEWIPDYNDPSNYVNSLMSNASSLNSAQINDPTLEAYILAGLQETDQDIRRQIYWGMQKYIVEELRPLAFGYVSNNYDVYVNELHGYPSNSLGYNYFYPCYYE